MAKEEGSEKINVKAVRLLSMSRRHCRTIFALCKLQPCVQFHSSYIPQADGDDDDDDDRSIDRSTFKQLLQQQCVMLKGPLN